MTPMGTEVLGIGLTGKHLTALERRILSENTPYAVVLFGRNIGTAEEFVELVKEVKSLAKAKPPVFMVDQEGGRVDRLRHILPGFPSAEAFGEGEDAEHLAEWHGRVIGMALRYFDVEIDLAPVVDIRAEVPTKGLERRMFGNDPETVTTLAGAFMRGMHATGTASCLKHWPGIGRGSADPHYGLTVIDVPIDDLLKHDIVPFDRLGNEAGAIMIGHGSYPQVDEEAERPATLSWRMTTDLLRNAIDFRGLAVSDDMEMHAVSDLGSYEDISEAALLAGNDVILFCSHIERVPDLQRFLRGRVNEDANVRARFDEARERCEIYRAHCGRLRKAAPRPESFEQVVDELSRFLEVFERTRPHREVVVPESERRHNPRKPRTGREEWT
jgi:beta-N-acetylhexosaminidase